ncbi:hypothetical protein EWX26_01100 [Campylobacter jejuni]|nr:hypothetical protein [Campylobacter jejuni]
MNIINEFFVSFILIKLYFKFKVCRKIKFPLLWKFYFSKWKFYFSADTTFEESLPQTNSNQNNTIENAPTQNIPTNPSSTNQNNQSKNQDGVEIFE